MNGTYLVLLPAQGKERHMFSNSFVYSLTNKHQQQICVIDPCAFLGGTGIFVPVEPRKPLLT